MGVEGVQKPATREEGRDFGALVGEECLWRGAWRTVVCVRMAGFSEC